MSWTSDWARRAIGLGALAIASRASHASAPLALQTRRTDAAMERAGIPPGTFVRVWSDTDGRGTFVHTTSLATLEDRATVRFWLITEERGGVIFAGQYALHCPTGNTWPIRAGLVGHGEIARAKPNFRNTGDTEQGAAVLRFVCERAWEDKTVLG